MALVPHGSTPGRGSVFAHPWTKALVIVKVGWTVLRGQWLQEESVEEDQTAFACVADKVLSSASPQIMQSKCKMRNKTCATITSGQI